MSCVDAELPPWKGAGRLATAAQEAQDERHDAELLAAVRASMRDWEMKHARTRSKRSQGSVCYGDFGCFEDSGPFAYLETLPSPPQEVDTHFLLYSTCCARGRPIIVEWERDARHSAGLSRSVTHRYVTERYTFHKGDQPLLAVSASNMSAAWGWAARAFDTARPTRVIVHGFGSNCDNVWVYEMRSALMAVEECNVICVDWEGGATMPNYLRAAANTRLVGKQLAMMLQGLAEHIDLRFEDVHLIGFSLGAHVAGFAGSELKNISRITGLDPAGPLFEFQDSRARLDRGDARFVDVIHSNGETLILGGLGAAQPLGHVDFYPNGGRVQHGCSNLFVGAVSDLVLPWAAPSPEGRSLCNHRRAYKFFTDSVSPKCHFPAFPCDNYDRFSFNLKGNCFPCGNDRRCGNMGYYADRSLGRGQLYLLTREEEPFCAHQYHVSVWAGGEKGDRTNYGRVTLTLHGDSGLNETFLMNKRDNASETDAARFTRMLVPHPALGVPLRATLHYAAYNGWLSAGARSLRLDKVLITDSFGKTSSFCKQGLELVTEEAVELPLYPGDCQTQQDDMAENTIHKEIINNASTRDTSTSDELHDEQPDAASNNFALVDTNEWSGRAFGLTNTRPAPSGGVEVAEPVLRPRPKKTPRQRADSDDAPHYEISEPLLKATASPSRTTASPLAARRAKNYDGLTTTTPAYELMSWGDKTEKAETGFAVQFLPTRLASFISRAERYARDTLLPLVSAYAPRLPIFGSREASRPAAKYIPTDAANVTETAPVPTPTLEMKIETLRTVAPPGARYEETPVAPDLPPVQPTAMMVSIETNTVFTTNTTSNDTDKIEHLEPAASDMLKVVAAPTMATGTALPPVAVRSELERLLIVYPSNTREDRKIRSHSFPEEMQFEALYQQTASPVLRVDLPTFAPPPARDTSPTLAADGSRFIPVKYPEAPAKNQFQYSNNETKTKQ
ncbi:Inactive pancreatic lipase-related protein 1 [Eumeta japonica]|uniref:Inactive pancreatic lipase-related protein 1 n=1 Tax=Eumeta variegata TaxID=151549 RepID=A0A4C1V210_EUMVA|nr:Inactive pancreatic lipase-related protein 1 [Eumeta japonica]